MTLLAPSAFQRHLLTGPSPCRPARLQTDYCRWRRGAGWHQRDPNASVHGRADWRRPRRYRHCRHGLRRRRRLCHGLHRWALQARITRAKAFGLLVLLAHASSRWIPPHSHTATRPHGHTATRPHGRTAARPHSRTPTQPHTHIWAACRHDMQSTCLLGFCRLSRQHWDCRGCWGLPGQPLCWWQEAGGDGACRRQRLWPHHRRWVGGLGGCVGQQQRQQTWAVLIPCCCCQV
jgi:hypothetical protein